MSKAADRRQKKGKGKGRGEGENTLTPTEAQMEELRRKIVEQRDTTLPSLRPGAESPVRRSSWDRTEAVPIKDVEEMVEAWKGVEDHGLHSHHDHIHFDPEVYGKPVSPEPIGVIPDDGPWTASSGGIVGTSADLTWTGTSTVGPVEPKSFTGITSGPIFAAPEHPLRIRIDGETIPHQEIQVHQAVDPYEQVINIITDPACETPNGIDKVRRGAVTRAVTEADAQQARADALQAALKELYLDSDSGGNIWMRTRIEHHLDCLEDDGHIVRADFPPVRD